MRVARWPDLSLTALCCCCCSSQESVASPPPAIVPSPVSGLSIPTPDMTSNMDGLRHLYGLGKTFGGMGGPSSTASGAGAAPFGTAGVKARPKIIYASRTHSQLAKVVKELKHSQYRPKITILGSRQQLCVHPVVSKLEGAGQTHACRSLTKDKMCQFYEHLPSQCSTYALRRCCDPARSFCSRPVVSSCVCVQPGVPPTLICTIKLWTSRI